jgi:predicted house-cleaning NTP pyrophosphatase (Maf/HAM1 superfamily)
LFLASQSPRRHSLLRDLGVPYEVVGSSADEILAGGPAARLAAANATAKVQHALLPPDAPDGAFVLGTDTLVTLADRVMGKPGSRDEAVAMIATLAGKTHQVVSGVALRRLAGAGDGQTMLREKGVEVHRIDVAYEASTLAFDSRQRQKQDSNAPESKRRQNVLSVSRASAYGAAQLEAAAAAPAVQDDARLALQGGSVEFSA